MSGNAIDCDVIFQGVETLSVKEIEEIDRTDKSNPFGSKYYEGMCLEIIEMFRRGETRSQFCALHTISNETFDSWRRKHPLFAAAYAVAHEKARAYYDELRQSHLEMEYDPEHKTVIGLNHALFNRMYNTRFNIPDKRAITIKALAKAKDEKQMLKAIMKAISEGELTPDEAQKLASLIDLSVKIEQNIELEARVKAIEEAQKIGADMDGFEEVPDEN